MHNIFKKIIFYLTKGFQIYFPNRKRRSTKFVYYPQFTSDEELSDHVNRIRWYLPESQKIDVRLFCIADYEHSDVRKMAPPSCHRTDLLDMDTSYIKISNCNSISFTEMKKADIICIWKVNGWRLLKLFPFIYKIRIVDPYYYKYSESHTNAGLLWYDVYDNEFRKKAKSNAKKIYTKYYQSILNHQGTSYLFGTGPSIEKAISGNYDDGISIICNTIVKNESLLNKINPKIITFTDCVFHFGVSKYCEIFLNDVEKVAREYDAIVVTNLVGYALISAHYPNLAKYIIGVPGYRIGGPKLLTPQSYKTRAYPFSIVTRIMLPLAAGISKKIIMIGFDGRDPSDTYFWKHNNTVQYDNNMKDVWDTHPTFFDNTDYKKHYEGHCKVLKKVVTTYETAGKQIEVWGNSYVPILREKMSGRL